jgi:putative intracellular protease/amidase
MSGEIDVLNPEKPRRVMLVTSNAAGSEQMGWPIGFWWAALTHPYWEFTERGYGIDVASPEGGGLQADSWSDLALVELQVARRSRRSSDHRPAAVFGSRGRPPGRRGARSLKRAARV